MNPDWVAGFLAAIPGVSALIALWRHSVRNERAAHRLTRAFNRHERELAEVYDREPQYLHPFDEDDGGDE
jgi:hypothetical protein